MQRDISVSYTLEQRLRNHMTLMEAVLNNIPAAVVVVDEQDRVVMDNLAYKTFCADCGGGSCSPSCRSPRPDDARRGGDPAGSAPRAARWLSVTCWPLPASVKRPAATLSTARWRGPVVIADCTQQRQQQEQGRLDRLKQQMTAGKLLAAIRESLDAALIQLNCPINMLAAARRLNGEEAGMWRWRPPGVKGKRRWRGSSAAARRWNSKTPPSGRCSPFRRSVRLYRTRFDPDGLQVDMASPHLIGFGQRTPLLACLSLWLDRTALAAELPSVPLAMQLYAEENDGWLSLYLTDNVPLLQVRYAHSPTR